MTGYEHAVEAERQLAEGTRTMRGEYVSGSHRVQQIAYETAMAAFASAQVHATLALLGANGVSVLS